MPVILAEGRILAKSPGGLHWLGHWEFLFHGRGYTALLLTAPAKGMFLPQSRDNALTHTAVGQGPIKYLLRSANCSWNNSKSYPSTVATQLPYCWGVGFISRVTWQDFGHSPRHCGSNWALNGVGWLLGVGGWTVSFFPLKPKDGKS